MKYMDEEITKLVYEKERQEKETKTEVSKFVGKEAPFLTETIDGEVIPFTLRTLLDNKIAIILPKQFTAMPVEQVKLKYPFEQRPDPIFTNEQMTINIGFTYTDEELDGLEMNHYKDAIVLMLKQTQRILEWYEDGVQEIHETTVGYAEFLTPALGTGIYNLMFFTALEGKVLIGTFNCTEAEMETWQPVAHRILGSFRILH